ncbi:MAG: permease, partial [Chloroflexota bacterium]
GLRGASLALFAGIASMGPAYAWYPLLGEVRQKGAGAGQVAVFLYGRAIKPFLLPVMAAYFGIVFTVVLNLLVAVGALFTGWIVGRLFPD